MTAAQEPHCCPGCPPFSVHRVHIYIYKRFFSYIYICTREIINNFVICYCIYMNIYILTYNSMCIFLICKIFLYTSVWVYEVIYKLRVIFGRMHTRRVQTHAIFMCVIIVTSALTLRMWTCSKLTRLCANYRYKCNEIKFVYENANKLMISFANTYGKAQETPLNGKSNEKLWQTKKTQRVWRM